MSTNHALDWWGDLQQDRDDLGGRSRSRTVDVWSDDDFDLVPARVLDRAPVSDELAQRRASRGHRFVRTEHAAAAAVADPGALRAEPSAPARHLELVVEDEDGIGRTVTISGRPGGRAVTGAERAERRNERQARRRSTDWASQPDRVAMWAVVLGFILILLAIISA